VEGGNRSQRGHPAGGCGRPARVLSYTRISIDEDHQKYSLDPRRTGSRRTAGHSKATTGASTRSTVTPRVRPT